MDTVQGMVNVEQLKEAMTDGEKAMALLKDIFPEESMQKPQPNKDKIYAFMSSNNDRIYKLHRVSGNKYAWICVENTSAYADGVYLSMEDAIKENNNDIYEFDDLLEFVTFIAESKLATEEGCDCGECKGE